MEAESRAESMILFMTDQSLTASWDNPIKGTGRSFNRGECMAKNILFLNIHERIDVRRMDTSFFF